MKRYFDEETGKIVNALTVEEANKIVKIAIDYFFVDTNMPKGRLNLMTFLKDFMRLASIEEISQFTKYIEEYKQTLKLNQEEQENFAMLYQFFKVYQDFSNENLNIEDAANYILEKRNQKEVIEKKDTNELTQKELILKVLFEKGFSFDRLAKLACETWEKKIQDKIKKDKQEVMISIEQEIAYQDLLDFASCSSVTGIKKLDNKVTEKKEEKNEKELKRQEPKEVKPEKKEQTIQINHGIMEEDVKARNHFDKQEKKETVATIQINPIVDLEDDVPPRPKKDSENIEEKIKKEEFEKQKNKENAYQYKKEPPITSNIHIFVPGVDDVEDAGLTQNPVSPLEIKKATEDVNLKESVDFFNDVLDDKLFHQNTDDKDGFRD